MKGRKREREGIEEGKGRRTKEKLVNVNHRSLQLQ